MKRYLCWTPALVLAMLAGGACRSADAPPPGGAAVDWPQVAAQLSAQHERLAGSPDMNPAARDSNLPLAQLEIERIQLRMLLNWRPPTWEQDQENSRRIALEALGDARAGRVALRGVTGGEGPDGYFTRAYRCATDGSAQPYYLRLPDDYSAERRYPLVIFLHGYVEETSKLNAWVLAKSQWDLAAAGGVIFCLPHGRRNSDFLGIGEVDVLRVIDDVQRFYSVDPERVYLTGCSMGGYGGWALGLRHPDRFAALALMSGQTDFFVWDRRPRQQTAFKSFCILQNNPVDLAVNARWLPMYVQHGELDNLVPVEHSRLITPVMERLGYDYRYDEREGLGHYLYWEDEPIARMLDSLIGKSRRAAPPRVTFRAYTTRFASAYWADLRRFHRKAQPAEIDAAVADGGLVATTTNVAELWLDVPAALRPGGSLALTVNGRPAGTIGAGPHQVTIAADGAPQPAAPGTPGPRPLMGPFRELFCAPFRVVIASGGGEAETAHNRQRAQDFQRDWYFFAEGLVQPTLDTELTAADVAGHNLLVFGEPATARLPGIADATALLPRGMALAKGRYQVGERRFEGDDLGCAVLLPHPLRQGGLIGFWSGADYGTGLPYNHQYDLLPELLVYNSQPAWDGTNQHLLGGFLTWDWQLDPSLLEEGAAGGP